MSLYDVFAKFFRTEPIRVRFSCDALHFSCGDAEAYLSPVIWFEGPGGSGRILGIGDRPPEGVAERVDLMADSFLKLSSEERFRALEILLRYGFKRVPQRRVQRPRVIFSNAALLASALDNREREALDVCALRSGAHEALFE